MINKNEFLRLFVAGCNVYDYKSSNLKAYHNLNKDIVVIVNYNTPIAYSKDAKIYLNNCKYSQTTSTNQNKIKRLCNQLNVELVEVDKQKCFDIYYQLLLDSLKN
jgi:hypothetical protein